MSIRGALCCIPLLGIALAVTACTSTPAAGSAPSPGKVVETTAPASAIAPTASDITTLQVRAYAARIVTLDTANAGSATYSAAAFTTLVDSRRITDEYLDALLPAATSLVTSSATAADLAVFRKVQDDYTEWHRWSPGKTNLDIAEVVELYNHGQTTAVSDDLATRISEAHDLATDIEEIDRRFGLSKEDGYPVYRSLPIARFNVLTGNRVVLLDGSWGTTTYHFAPSLNGSWRVVGIEQEDFAKNLREFLILNEPY